MSCTCNTKLTTYTPSLPPHLPCSSCHSPRAATAFLQCFSPHMMLGNVRTSEIPPLPTSLISFTPTASFPFFVSLYSTHVNPRALHKAQKVRTVILLHISASGHAPCMVTPSRHNSSCVQCSCQVSICTAAQSVAPKQYWGDDEHD
jgi:hypothetical protein